MITQSKAFASQCLWFSSLVSKREPAGGQAGLSRVGARQVRVLEMAQGNKISRVLAWSFLDEAASKQWWSPMAHNNA